MEVNPASDLEQVRAQINKLISEKVELPKLNPDWCFVDSCTAERFFRVDRAQEHLHYVIDISAGSLFILDTGAETVPQTPDEERTSPIANKQYSIPEMKVSDESLNSPTEKPDSVDSMTSIDEPVVVDTNTQATPPQTPTLDTKLASVNGKLKEFTFEQPPPNSPLGFKSNLLEKTSDGILKAAKHGDIKTLRELHQQGYSLMSIDSQGQTALHYGARYGHKDIIKYLIASAPTAILNMADNDKGQTALHKAASCKRRQICCMLVAGGASLTIRDHRGATPRLLALGAEDNELAAYLESQEHFQLVSEDIETVV